MALERHVGEGGGKFWLVERRDRSGTRDVGLVAEAIDGRQLVLLAMHWCAGRLDSKTRFHRAGQVGR